MYLGGGDRKDEGSPWAKGPAAEPTAEPGAACRWCGLARRRCSSWMRLISSDSISRATRLSRGTTCGQKKGRKEQVGAGERSDSASNETKKGPPRLCPLSPSGRWAPPVDRKPASDTECVACFEGVACYDKGVVGYEGVVMLTGCRMLTCDNEGVVYYEGGVYYEGIVCSEGAPST